jgi:hypothetical protein
LTVALLAVAAVACEGPVGPQGPAGTAGAAGPQGPAGPAGATGNDANATCTQCHTGDVTMYAKQLQYQQSAHNLGGNFERNSTSCAVCHTHQGFLERLPTNALTTAATIENPAPQNCRTCHQIHQTYTSADYALTATTAFPLWSGAKAATVDLGAASGNLCARCHQARTTSPMPTLGGDPVTVTSTRYGWHYSPVANVMSSTGAFAFTGSFPTPTTAHVHGDPAFNPKTCATCHMATATGDLRGGHTLKMFSVSSSGAEVQNINGCQECHKTVENFDHFGLRGEIDGLLADLHTELVRLGIGRAGTHYAITGTYPADVAAGFLNWYLFTEDKSHGIHNPTYAKNVLRNTLAKMKTY